MAPRVLPSSPALSSDPQRIEGGGPAAAGGGTTDGALWWQPARKTKGARHLSPISRVACFVPTWPSAGTLVQLPGFESASHSLENEKEKKKYIYTKITYPFNNHLPVGHLYSPIGLLLGCMHEAKSFRYIMAFNPHTNPMKFYLHFTVEPNKAQRS